MRTAQPFLIAQAEALSIIIAKLQCAASWIRFDPSESRVKARTFLCNRVCEPIALGGTASSDGVPRGLSKLQVHHLLPACRDRRRIIWLRCIRLGQQLFPSLNVRQPAAQQVSYFLALEDQKTIT
jgi:hypothetical protein